MADRYVNYDDLLKKWHDLGFDEISKIHKVNAFNHFIKNLPTVDVAEVVYCSECKYAYFNKAVCGYSCKRRDYFSEFVKPTDFCSYGERKM